MEKINKNQNQIAGAIIIAGLVIAGAILLKGQQTKTTIDEKNISFTTIKTKEISQNDHIVGNPNAELIIVEYSDSECPFCKVFHNTMTQIMTQNSEKITWIYKHFPIAELHSKAFHESVAMECAWEQGANDSFWKYANELFNRTTSNNRLEVSELPKIAQVIGLDINKFNTCLSTEKYADKVKADMKEGVNAGARGTPYSVIITKNNITAKIQKEIIEAIGEPKAVSFDKENKKVMSLNGALPLDMINKILSILLK
jgi:protein-disulfide isomerase